MSDRSVRALVRKVCLEQSFNEPPVTFGYGRWAHAHSDGITLPSYEWLTDFDAADGKQHRLLVLHELAHWSTGREGHTPEFYLELFELCQRYGIKVSYAYDDEVKYKPRAARAGLELLVA